jgi:hypothetical protein
MENAGTFKLGMNKPQTTVPQKIKISNTFSKPLQNVDTMF